MKAFISTAAFAVILELVSAQSSCSTILTPTNSAKPSVASGYRMQLVATGLSKPRGIEFDTAGNLLVVEQGTGDLTALTLQDNGGCVSVSDTNTVVTSQSLNHGLAVSSDGKTVYASSSEAVWSWAYDASAKTSSNQQTLVMNMTTDDHTTRTLLLSKKVPGLLLVSRGSTSNIDIEAASLASGHSEIKAFNLNKMSGTAYDFDTAGLRLGWGLRNSVGVAEHPTTGGIYSVENSADQITRDGVDVHQNNPGEEMNFHGYLDGTKYAPQGGNYGYPWCFSAWGVDELPENGNLSVGSQFALAASNYPNDQNRTDVYCAAQNAPRLTFQAHMAPLDIKFNNSGTEGWVTYHGSWDRTDPVGYKMSVIQFANGEPVDPPTSKTAIKDIFYNADNSVCPGQCFRPVGMAFDGHGRLFVSSDATGEIYMVTREKSPAAVSSSSSTTSSGTATSTGTSTSTGSQASSTSDGRRLVTGIVTSLQVGVIVACMAAAFAMI